MFVLLSRIVFYTSCLSYFCMIYILSPLILAYEAFFGRRLTGVLQKILCFVVTIFFIILIKVIPIVIVVLIV